MCKHLAYFTQDLVYGQNNLVMPCLTTPGLNSGLILLLTQNLILLNTLKHFGTAGRHDSLDSGPTISRLRVPLTFWSQNCENCHTPRTFRGRVRRESNWVSQELLWRLDTEHGWRGRRIGRKKGDQWEENWDRCDPITSCAQFFRDFSWHLRWKS